MKKKVKRFIVSFLLIVSMVVSQCVNVGLAFADEPNGVQMVSEVEENQTSETQQGKTDSVLNNQIEVGIESEAETNISGETETQLETANDEQLEESELADKKTESTDDVDSESMESDGESERTEETQNKDYIIKVIKTNGSIVDVVNSANAGDIVEVYVKASFYPTISVLSENEVFQNVDFNGYDSEKNAYVFQFVMPSYDVHISVYSENQIALLSTGDTYTVGVSDYRYVEKDQAGYTISTGYFELTNGQQAFCCMHEKLAPTVGMVLTEAEKYTAENQLNETMRKVLYYGWHGPADTGVSYSITALAVSVANGHDDNYFKYGTAWINNTLANLPAPPASFTVTKLNNPNAAYQDLVFWSIEKAYIQTEKNFEGGNNSYNPDVDAALYTIYTDAACTNEYHTPYISGNPSSFRIESNLKSGVITVEPGTYYIKETHAPSGWELDTRVYTVNASINTTASNPAKVTSTDKPSNGGFYLTKSSTYTEIVKNNNCYSLENAEYGVYSNANCAESSRIGTLKTDKNGKTQTLSVKKGTYYIKELTAPKGYMLDNKVYSVTVQASKTVEVKVQDKPYNDPSGIEITKIAADTAEVVPLDGTQFTVCYYDGFYTKDNLPNQATRTWILEIKGEKDGNGKTSYRVDLRDKYKVGGDEFYYIGNFPVIPLGTITIEETKPANGYTIVGGYIQIEGTSEKLTGKYVAQIRSNQDGAYLVGGNQYTGVNYPVPDLSTQAKDAVNGTQSAKVSNNVKLVDTSMMERLVVGESYELRTSLVNKSTGQILSTVDGKNQISTTFTATAKSMNIDTEMTIDASNLSGCDVVFYEELYFRGTLVTEHKDINATGQTVHFSEIGTTALDKDTNDHVSNAAENMTIIDTVAYKNLEVGKTYTVTGILMDKETGKAALDDAGKEIKSNTTFTATSINGTVDVVFSFSGVKLKGKTLVAFESVSSDGVEYAVHANINDEGQSIHIPEIHTTALDKSSGSHNILAGEKSIIVDTVAFKNLIAGKEYTVTGMLMDKASGKALQDAEGNAITSTVKFTPEESDGSIDIEFTFDASGLAGTTIVVFESVLINEKEVGIHADLEDEAQTIYVPKIHTTALDESSGSHNILASEKAVIVDTVAYKNLIVGKEYTVTGTLINKGTGEAVLDAEGNAITSAVKFVPEAANGSIDVTFEIDASALENETLVVFEEVLLNEKKVGIHADIEDTEQTIYVPEIHTNALDKSSGSHNILAGKEVTIVDTVSYKNLIVGQEYTVKGILMDKSTGDAIKDADGQNVSSKVTFTPENVNGSIDVEFTFDASNLENKTIVVFESIFVNEREVAVHADIEDEAQTMYIPEIRTTAQDKLSGSHNMLAQKDAVIIDTVNYKNLIIGQTYTITGTLMDKSTGKAIQDANGKPVISSVTFTAEKVNGSIDIEFKFDASALAGTTIVAFESVLVNGKEVGVHADIEDEAQTIYVPEIHTTATDKADGDKKIISSSTVTITDKVEYKNLIPGKTYTVKGILMDKSTGKELLINNLPVTSSVTFTAEKANGSINVDFTFNATGLKNRDVVVFETLLLDDFEIAVHEDIEDEGQTIHMLEKPGTLVPNYNNKNVKTGDDKPIFAILMVLLMSFIVTLSIVLYKRKLKKEL